MSVTRICLLSLIKARRYFCMVLIFWFRMVFFPVPCIDRYISSLYFSSRLTFGRTWVRCINKSFWYDRKPHSQVYDMTGSRWDVFRFEPPPPLPLNRLCRPMTVNAWRHISSVKIILSLWSFTFLRHPTLFLLIVHNRK